MSKNYSHLIDKLTSAGFSADYSARILERMIKADEGSSRTGSALPWLVKTFIAGGFRDEDIEKAGVTLQEFREVMNKLPSEMKFGDELRNPKKLGSYPTLASMAKIVASVARKKSKKDIREEDKSRAISESHVICHREDGYKVAVPLTEFASKWWGRGTQWCTSANKNNMFSTYNMEAPLIIISVPNEEYGVLKFQMQVVDGDFQFMDEHDAVVEPEIVEAYWEYFEPLIRWAVSEHGAALEYVPMVLRTHDINLSAVSSYGRSLELIPFELRSYDLCLAAVTNDGASLQYVPEAYRDEVMCNAAISSEGTALGWVPKVLINKSMCIKAVSQNVFAVQDVPNHLRDRAVMEAEVRKDGGRILDVPERFRDNRMYLCAAKSENFSVNFIPEHLRTVEMYLAAIETNGRSLSYFPLSLRTYENCTKAVSVTPSSIEYVPEEILDKQLILLAVENDGMSLYRVPESERCYDVCRAAVSQNGNAIQFVPAHLIDLDLCQLAANNGLADIDILPDEFRDELNLGAIIMPHEWNRIYEGVRNALNDWEFNAANEPAGHKV